MGLLNNFILTVFPLAVGIFGIYLWRRDPLKSKRPCKEKGTNGGDGETATNNTPRSSKPSQALPVNNETEPKTLDPKSIHTDIHKRNRGSTTNRNCNETGPKTVVCSEPKSTQTGRYERKESTSNQNRDETEPKTLQPNNRHTERKESSDNWNSATGDLEVDAPESIFPSTPVSLHRHSEHAEVVQFSSGYQETPFETHDALILYAEKDASLAQQLQQDLVENVDLPNLNVILYEEFAPEVQSHFGTMTILFQRCRYLLVFVTKNFTEASFSKFQHEIALKDSIENSEKNERVIPVWGEIGAKDIVMELSVFKGIDYSLSLQGDDRSRVFFQFKKAFEYGRKNIKNFPKQQ